MVTAAVVAVFALVFILSDTASFPSNRGALLAQSYTTKDDILKRFQSDREAIQRSNEEIKELMSQTLADIKKRNLKFKAELTEQMKYKIADITGAETPEGLERDASVKWNISSNEWDSFKKKYSHLFRDRKKEREAERRKAEEKRKRLEEQKRLAEERKRLEEKKRLEKEMAELEKKENELEGDKLETDILSPPSPALPAFTWLDRKMVSPVKNQGSCGSCWAFTSGAVLEANWLIRNGELVKFSEQEILDCASYNNGRDAGSCNGGWYGGVFDNYKNKSAQLESKIPYKVKEDVCRPGGQSKYKIAAWGYVKPDAGIPSVQQMKEALCKYGPVAACVKVTPAFQAYAGGIFDEHAPVSGSRDINHAITIVGWDDSKKAYMVKNSWGERWGEKGYVWVEYGCNNIGYGAAWIVVERK